uniref:Uncharacterized protein n=1 Tax=Caenorhabditis japonica TaxID=281687 RepID=A0A8R1EGK0_CAEJA
MTRFIKNFKNSPESRYFVIKTVCCPEGELELERRLKGVRASNANQKFAQLEAAWKSIPMTVVQTLLDSMSRRCQAVIDAQGYPTKY